MPSHSTCYTIPLPSHVPCLLNCCLHYSSRHTTLLYAIKYVWSSRTVLAVSYYSLAVTTRDASHRAHLHLAAACHEQCPQPYSLTPIDTFYIPSVPPSYPMRCVYTFALPCIQRPLPAALCRATAALPLLLPCRCPNALPGGSCHHTFHCRLRDANTRITVLPLAAGSVGWVGV